MLTAPAPSLAVNWSKLKEKHKQVEIDDDMYGEKLSDDSDDDVIIENHDAVIYDNAIMEEDEEAESAGSKKKQEECNVVFNESVLPPGSFPKRKDSIKDSDDDLYGDNLSSDSSSEEQSEAV